MQLGFRTEKFRLEDLHISGEKISKNCTVTVELKRLHLELFLFEVVVISLVWNILNNNVVQKTVPYHIKYYFLIFGIVLLPEKIIR
jgi:hypothetical protein